MSVDSTLYKSRVWILPEKVRSLGTIPKSIRMKYLANNTKYRINNPIVREAVRKAIGHETNPYWIARRIYQFVLDKLDYKRAGGWDSVPLLLERGTGSCSEYTFVLIALCRAAGIPARWVGGGVTRGDDAFVDNVFHRWAEIYLPAYGWIPVDPDRGDKKTPRGQALGFGNINDTLLVTTVSGGESAFLGWEYNGNVNWSFKGRTRVYVEKIGELAPSTGADGSSPKLIGPKSKELPLPVKSRP
jgi:transglutaminase-like putative cysteine protease